MTTRRVGLVAAAGALLYSAAIAIAATSDHASVLVAIPIAAGLSFTAAGIVACVRRPDNRTGVLMLEVGLFWALGALTFTSSSLLFTVGALTQQLAFAPLGHLLLSYPTGVLDRRYHRRLVAALWGVVGLGPLLIALLERQPTNCDDCPDSLIQIWHGHAAAVAVEGVYTVVALGLGVAILVELVRRYRGAGTPLRRVLKPVYGTFALALVFLILGNGIDPVSHSAATVFEVLAVTSLALVPVGFLVGLLRSRLARGSVVRLLMELEEGTPLREALSEALGDPSLVIAYCLDNGSRWVDADGRGVSEPTARPGRAVTTVEHRGERVAALVHDASLDEEPDLVQGVAAAAALSLHSQRLQAELRNQFEFLRTLFNTAPSLLVNVDVEGRILNHNSATTEASGRSSDEQLRGRYFWDVFVDPEDVDELRERFAAAAPAFEGAEYENTFTNAKGEQRVIDWRSAPVYDENGAVTSIIAGGVDITERKQHEVELRESEERLRAVIQSSPVAIVEVDLENRVVRWNPAAEEIFGWTEDEVIGHPAPIIAQSIARSRTGSTSGSTARRCSPASRRRGAARTERH